MNCSGLKNIIEYVCLEPKCLEFIFLSRRIISKKKISDGSVMILLMDYGIRIARHWHMDGIINI